MDALIAADSLLNVGDTKGADYSRVATQPATPVPFHAPTPVPAALFTPLSRHSDSVVNGKQSPAKKKAKILTLGIEPCDFVGDDLSAFDNTVIRPIDANKLDLSLLAYNGHQGFSRIAPKRSHSVPAIPNLPNIRGQQHIRLIHSILSSTVDPPSSDVSSTSQNVSTQPRPPSYSSSNPSSYYHGSSRGNSDRPFVCPVPGCGKTYKNANGLKYHAIHGHDGVLVEKPHKCPFAGCGKRYKNSNGLKYHFQHAHPNSMPPSSSGSSSSSSLSYVPSRPSSIPPPMRIPTTNSIKLPEGINGSNSLTIANLIKSNPMVKQHLPAILRNLQQMALQRSNTDNTARKPPSN